MRGIRHPLHRRLGASCLRHPAGSLERLLEVRLEVVDVLEADRQAHETRA